METFLKIGPQAEFSGAVLFFFFPEKFPECNLPTDRGQKSLVLLTSLIVSPIDIWCLQKKKTSFLA